MRYLCLIYGEEEAVNALSEEEQARLSRDALAYDETLRRSGHYIVSNALQPARSAAGIGLRHGKLLVTDGPFAETKEQLLGFILIDAADREEAIAVASKFPLLGLATVEVREVRWLEGEQP